jgi:HEAT repeat protein
LEIYYKIMGGDEEKLYLDLLNDTDIGVQRRAIRCLSGIKSKTGLEKFLEMLHKGEDLSSDKNLQMEASLYSALGSYGDSEIAEVESLEGFLIETLDRRVSLGPFRFLKKKKRSLSEGSIAAICETLGKIGTGKSHAILKKLEKHKDRLWTNTAEEALLKISERQQDKA